MTPTEIGLKLEIVRSALPGGGVGCYIPIGVVGGDGGTTMIIVKA